MVTATNRWYWLTSLFEAMVSCKNNVMCLSFLVGKSTSCSGLQSAMVSRNVVLTRLVYWELATVKSFQRMSGKLNSPMRRGAFLHLALSCES